MALDMLCVRCWVPASGVAASLVANKHRRVLAYHATRKRSFPLAGA